jgi:hypothetical protein
MRKKKIVLILVSSLCLLLSSCGSSGNGQAQKVEPAVEETESSAQIMPIAPDCNDNEIKAKNIDREGDLYQDKCKVFWVEVTTFNRNSSYNCEFEGYFADDYASAMRYEAYNGNFLDTGRFTNCLDIYEGDAYLMKAMVSFSDDLGVAHFQIYGVVEKSKTVNQ